MWKKLWNLKGCKVVCTLLVLRSRITGLLYLACATGRPNSLRNENILLHMSTFVTNFETGWQGDRNEKTHIVLPSRRQLCISSSAGYWHRWFLREWKRKGAYHASTRFFHLFSTWLDPNNPQINKAKCDICELSNELLRASKVCAVFIDNTSDVFYKQSSIFDASLIHFFGNDRKFFSIWLSWGKMNWKILFFTTSTTLRSTFFGAERTSNTLNARCSLLEAKTL